MAIALFSAPLTDGADLLFNQGGCRGFFFNPKKRALIDLGTSLAERQEQSGGWAHGPGGPNALGYVELNILTGLALCGMGLAGQAGYDTNESVLELAETYLKQSSNGDGGVGYSCIAEIRMIETIESGKPTTQFLKFGDRVRIEMRDDDGLSIFGAIDHEVQQY